MHYLSIFVGSQRVHVSTDEAMTFTTDIAWKSVQNMCNTFKQYFDCPLRGEMTNEQTSQYTFTESEHTRWNRDEPVMECDHFSGLIMSNNSFNTDAIKKEFERMFQGIGMSTSDHDFNNYDHYVIDKFWPIRDTFVMMSNQFGCTNYNEKGLKYAKFINLADRVLKECTEFQKGSGSENFDLSRNRWVSWKHKSLLKLLLTSCGMQTLYEGRGRTLRIRGIGKKLAEECNDYIPMFKEVILEDDAFSGEFKSLVKSYIVSLGLVG